MDACFGFTIRYLRTMTMSGTAGRGFAAGAGDPRLLASVTFTFHQ